MAAKKEIEELLKKPYEEGFYTEIEEIQLPPGLSEETIYRISELKKEPKWMLEWRLRAFRLWLKMEEPHWAHVRYGPIDYQAISYFAAPKSVAEGPKSLDEVDPQLLETFEKLGIPLHERAALAGVAVDAVFDSVSVATTFRDVLEKAGVIFCPISEAIQRYPDLVRNYLGSVVPPGDNFFAALNSAVFSDGTFVYVPPGVRCPVELSTYFRINAAKAGQFERTLIIADKGAYVSYLEGCLPPWEEVSYGDRMVNIREVAIGDTVLNALGQETKVSKIMRRGYRGELIEITPCSTGNRFALTPEHPVLVIQREKLGGGSKGWSDIDPQKLNQAKPEYVPAGELKEGDLLVFPINQVERDDPSLDDHFLRLLGHYLAEGRVTHVDGHQVVEFSLGLHEEEIISEIRDLIEKLTGKRGSVIYDRKRNGAYVVVDDEGLMEKLSEHGGRLAHEKRLSKAVMDLPPERQRLVLESYCRGDGHVTGKGRLTRVRVTTVSRTLAFQVQELLSRQGVFAFLSVREPDEEKFRSGRSIRRRCIYTLDYTPGARSQRVIKRDGYFLVPIRQIKRLPFEGYVYNFETETDPHSYLVKGFAVHNCTAPRRSEHQLHAAVVELIALEGAHIKYSTVQNWYPGDEEGRGGIYNFVTKRGDCREPRARISWTQIETGSAITWKYPSCILRGDESIGEFYSVALTNHRQQADTGTKMIHLGKNTRSTIIAKGIAAGRSQNTYRGLVRILRSAEGARNYTQCDSLLIGDTCGAHTFPYIEVKNPTAKVEHEATTSRIGDEQLFYCRQRGIKPEDAVSLIVSGFCKEVFKELPMEFAVEAQRLLGVSLEGSIG